MTIYRKSALAAAALALSLSAARADTPACSLGLMASLDMSALADGRFTVPVSINGSQHQFLVETAGVFSKIAPDLATKLALPQTPTRAEVYGAKGLLHMNSAEVNSFKIGANEMKRFHLAATTGDSDLTDGIEGTLAPDLLILFDVELDFAKNKMNLFSQDHCPGKVVYWTQGGYATLPFRMMSGPATLDHHIEFTTTLDGHDLSTVLDTSSSTTWLRHKPAVEFFSFDEKAPDVALDPQQRADLPVYKKHFQALHLGGIDAPNPTIDVMPDEYEASFRQQHSEKSRDDPIYGGSLATTDLTVGVDVLRKLHVYIAYKEHKVYATAADAH